MTSTGMSLLPDRFSVVVEQTWSREGESIKTSPVLAARRCATDGKLAGVRWSATGG